MKGTAAPIKLVVVMYFTTIATLWVSTRILGPAGYETSLPRAALTAILMSFSGKLLNILLKPLVGDWYSLALLPVYVLLVKAILFFPFWRSVLVAVIYITVVATIYYFVSPST